MLDLSVEQVRRELETIIRENPNNNGAMPEDTNDYEADKDCVYFLDQYGEGFGLEDQYREDLSQDRQFTTPVCIIGHWIDQFHPELKEVAELKELLSFNNVIQSSVAARALFPEDVHALLASAQFQQDSPGRTWADIDLDELRGY